MIKLIAGWKNKYAEQSLHQKIRLAILLFSLVPLLLLAGIFFWYIYTNQIGKIREDIREDMERRFVDVLYKMSTVQTMANVIWADTTFTTDVGQAAINDNLGEYNRYLFQKQTLSVLRVITNTSQVEAARLHLEYPGLREYSSFLYNMDRAKESLWYEDRSTLEYQGRWYMNALDQQEGGIYNNYFVGKNMASYIIPVKISNNLTGVFEMVIPMNVLVRDLYEYNVGQDLFLADETGRISGIEKEGLFDGMTIDHLTEIMQVDFTDRDRFQKVQVCQGIWKREPVILAAVGDAERGILLLQIVSIKEQYLTMLYQIIGVSLLEILMTIVLYQAINGIVKRLLYDFNVFSSCMKEVENGNLDVEIPRLHQVEINAVATEYNRMLEKVKELMELAVHREVMVRDAQLKSLEKQIDSHFLYNVLDSIKMMAEVKGIYNVSDSLLALGRMFRYNLQIDTHCVTLQEEISYLESYLNLRNIRYDYHIELSENIEDMVKMLKVPKVILQPVAENSIIHGLDELAEDTTIYLKAYVEGDCAYIEMTDMGKGMDNATLEKVRLNILHGGAEDSVNGIGLRNIHERIRLMYGEGYGVTVYSEKECYTKVVFTIPAEV